jgi:transposase InsO family protein
VIRLTHLIRPSLWKCVYAVWAWACSVSSWVTILREFIARSKDRPTFGRCAIRVTAMWSFEDARRAVTQYVEHYNDVRLHSAIGYVTPRTKLERKEKELFQSRDRKLEAAREERRSKRAASQRAIA